MCKVISKLKNHLVRQLAIKFDLVPKEDLLASKHRNKALRNRIGYLQGLVDTLHEEEADREREALNTHVADLMHPQ